MFELYAMQLPKTHGAECPTYGILNLNRVSFNCTENFWEHRRREPLGRCGGMPPRKISNLKALKRNFQHSQADSCVQKVPKIDCYFLRYFDEKSIVIIFIINNYCHTPLMLAKYDTSYLPRTKTCTVYFYLLFIYAPRVYSYLAGKKIGH